MNRSTAVGVAMLLALALSLTAASSLASTPPCSSATAKRINSGSAGPVVCSSHGIKTVWVARQITLRLSSMHVHVLATGFVKSLELTSGGTVTSQATAKGEFVVIIARVTNETQSAQTFDDVRQTELEIGGRQFSPSRDGQASDHGAQAFTTPITPGQSTVGDLVYDVPTGSAAHFPLRAGLVLVNFGASVSAGSVREVGSIYLG